MTDDATLYKRLRLETIALLNFVEPLSVAQTTKVDLVSSLRLALDGLTARQLRGETIDLNKLLSAAESLERLLPRGAAQSELNDADLRAKMAALIAGYREADDADRNEKIATLEAELAEKDRVIAEKNSVIAALGGSITPRAAEPPTPEQTSPQPPLPTPSAPVPVQYLRDPTSPFHAESGRERFKRPQDWENR